MKRLVAIAPVPHLRGEFTQGGVETATVFDFFVLLQEQGLEVIDGAIDAAAQYHNVSFSADREQVLSIIEKLIALVEATDERVNQGTETTDGEN